MNGIFPSRPLGSDSIPLPGGAGHVQRTRHFAATLRFYYQRAIAPESGRVAPQHLVEAEWRPHELGLLRLGDAAATTNHPRLAAT